MAGTIRSSLSASASGSSGSWPSITQVLISAAHPPVTKTARSASMSGSSGTRDIRRATGRLTGESRPLSALVSSKPQDPVIIAR
jgi:hypothetical protein